jgi:hypothetical protein
MPAAAPTSVRLTHAVWTTCAAALSASTPRRVSGADEISPSANAVTVTSVAPSTYAYERLVTCPTPSAAARRSAIT